MNDVFVIYSNYAELSNDETNKPKILEIITVCADEYTAKAICRTLNDKFQYYGKSTPEGKFSKIEYNYEICSDLY
jgi:hypothetical protein